MFFVMIIDKEGIKAESEPKLYVTPHEGTLHMTTWMAYGATKAAWGTKTTYGPSRSIARKDLIRIAAILARFEPVKMIINENDFNETAKLITEIKSETVKIYRGGKPLLNFTASGDIEFIKFPLDDFWIRDLGVTFIFDPKNKTYAVKFNFNGWGQRNTGAQEWKKCPLKTANRIPNQRILEDQNIADFIIKYNGMKNITTWLVMEGGAIEVNGKGTAICTESSILNNNRNPGKTKEDVEKELLRVLGIKKVIWLPGTKGKEITDGHVEFYARFVDDLRVAYSLEKNKDGPEFNITNINKQILTDATDSEGKKLTIIPFFIPDLSKVEVAFNLRNGLNNNKSFYNYQSLATNYLGFYLANNCVMMQKFGDDTADKAALDTMTAIFPNKTIIQITIDGITNVGGSIHSATQQQIYP